MILRLFKVRWHAPPSLRAFRQLLLFMIALSFMCKWLIVVGSLPISDRLGKSRTLVMADSAPERETAAGRYDGAVALVVRAFGATLLHELRDLGRVVEN
jgi:hypothetical protein